MTYPRTLAAVGAALIVLSACNREPEVVGGPADPQAEALKNRPKVQLPPSIKASKIYRCKDNSVVYATFMTDNVTAEVRDKQEQPPRATLKAGAPGQPYEGSGYSLSGSGDNITYKSPDSGTQTCHT